MWEGLFTTSEVLCYYAGFVAKKKRLTLCCSVAIGPRGKDRTWPWPLGVLLPVLTGPGS